MFIQVFSAALYAFMSDKKNPATQIGLWQS